MKLYKYENTKTGHFTIGSYAYWKQWTVDYYASLAGNKKDVILPDDWWEKTKKQLNLKES